MPRARVPCSGKPAILTLRKIPGNLPGLWFGWWFGWGTAEWGRLTFKSMRPFLRPLLRVAVFFGGMGSAGAVPLGAVLRLDAAEQGEARQQAALPPLRDGGPLDRWVELGGTGVVWQASRAAMPVWRGRGKEALVRFDGKDDYLWRTGGRRLAAEATVVVLAAPRGNPGAFSALFSMAEAGQNDYTSGLSLDFGPVGTAQLSAINVETAGAGGVYDFLEPGRNVAADLPFGGFHVFTVRSKMGAAGNEVFLDGLRLGERLRMESQLGMDVMALGARMCSNEAEFPPFANGFFQGDLAVVQVYDRALAEGEREEVEGKLLARIPGLNALAVGAEGHALEVLGDAPVVQFLAPGFAVNELPLALTNRNNLRYRHDGKLVALGYDGTIHLLSDSDGDGLEDRATVFWGRETLRGPLGMALLPAGDPRGEGVLVASKGKISLILDRDRDGVAEEEVVVATGWQEIPQNVDAVGLAVDPRDGSLYFSLGCANYANGYMIDPATGRAGYDLKSERGTIQRVSADFKSRETVCTGVRFACALAFNRAGDLFATEQEGATWLPNGNPLDELLHILPGKHYGFPPRHPRHLPGVLDWPAVVEYGPQHQSAVGMVFNEGVNGGRCFGPAFWEGDALVCGEARGKLWRTKLVKTPQGYVGQNTLLACLGLLTVDCCVSPQGDLVIACHSGPPDWGTGPKGMGRLFKVSYAGRELPQPVRAWASAPDEFRIAFDRQLDAADWAGAAGRARLEAGRYVSAGDRFEVIRPGYQVVRDQMGSPRRAVPVQGLSLDRDGRTLVVKVPRQTEPVGYGLTLPLPEGWRQPGGVAQRMELDVLVTLQGVQVPSAVGEGSEIWPSTSLAVNQALALPGGGGRKAGFRGGNGVELTGLLERSDVFRPNTQPGAKLDWEPEHAWGAFEARGVTGTALPGADGEGGRLAAFRLTTDVPDAAALAGQGLYAVQGAEQVPLPLGKTLVPWAREGDAAPAPLAAERPAGSWMAGRAVFFSDAAGCATCHQIRGEGVALGPDLTNLVSRDRASVWADIRHPSASINPDHPASAVRLKSGVVLTGMVRRAEGGSVQLALAGGAVQSLARGDIAEMALLPTSLMPEGYGDRLSPGQQDDLLTFLLTNPLEPAPLLRAGGPPARSWAGLPEPLRAALRGLPAGGEAPLRLLLCAGPKDHGLGEHDYPLWLERWSTLLGLAPGVTVARATDFPSAAQLAAADVAIFYSRNPGWNAAAAARLDAFTERGGGLVYLHWAVEGYQDVLLLAERIGLATQGGVTTKFRHGPVRLDLVTREHPITRGFPASLELEDETYWNLQGDPARLTPLATGNEEGAAHPQLWVRQQHQGRVVVCLPGHYSWTFDDPLYRLLVLRSIAWAGRQAEVDRLSGLGTIGARMAP